MWPVGITSSQGKNQPFCSQPAALLVIRLCKQDAMQELGADRFANAHVSHLHGHANGKNHEKQALAMLQPWTSLKIFLT